MNLTICNNKLKYLIFNVYVFVQNKNTKNKYFAMLVSTEQHSKNKIQRPQIA